MTSKLSRKHHTVPEFFLRRFLAPGEVFLQEYFKPRGEWRRTSPKRATVEVDANLYEGELGLTDVMENEFSRIETLVGPLFDALTKDRTPSAFEREGLASFLSLQILRGRMARSFWLQAKSHLQQAPESLRLVDNCKSKIEHKFGNDQFNSLRENVAKTGLRLPIGFGLEQLPRMHPKLGLSLSMMNWRLELPVGKERFVVSDNPVVPVDRFRPFSETIASIFGHQQQLEVSCPIDPMRCLVCSWEVSPIWAKSVSDVRVLEINRRTAMAAQRSVYGGTMTERTRAVIEQQRMKSMRLG